MKNLKYILSSLVFLLSLSFTQAQSSISEFKVVFKASETVNASNVPQVLFDIAVSDTVNVSAVLITLGSTNGGSEFFSYSVNLNGTNLPQGVSLVTNNNKIEINTGAHSGVIKYYASAKLQYANGTFSALSAVNNVE